MIKETVIVPLVSLIFKGLQFFGINLVLVFSTQNLLFAENSLWSLKPIKKIIIPNNGNTNWALNSVDEFILRKLSAESLSPSARANRHSIIRRASYDLTGLPPRPETVRDFLNDPDDDAISCLLYTSDAADE